MAAYRKIVFAPGQIYHVINRGIERRNVFINKREYERAVKALEYYRCQRPPVRLSRFFDLDQEKQTQVLELVKKLPRRVTIIAYCLMPNHFHLVLREELDKGIMSFVADFTNSYSRYFNTKHRRIGPLFEGIFKAVWVETDEQLRHLTRYVHLNPVSSFLVKESGFLDYPWSSLSEYLGTNRNDSLISDPSLVLEEFKDSNNYREFVTDQISYAKELEKIKHLALEEIED